MKQEFVSAVIVHRGVTSNGVFLVKRKNTQAHLRGYTTFPSGKIISQSQTLLDQCKIKFPDIEPRLSASLCRLVEKKLDIRLMDAWDLGIVAGIRYLGQDNGFEFPPYDWTNHFLLIELNRRIPFEPVGKDLESGRWIPPGRAMREFAEGNLLLEPSVRNLLEIMQYDLTAEGREEFAMRIDHDHEVPWFEPLPGIIQMAPRACTFPPINRTNCFIVGDEGKRRFLVDPSPSGDDEYRKLSNTLLRHNWTDILITHHHPDHTEQLPRLVKDFPAPISIHPEAKRIITSKQGADCLKGLDIRLVEDGDELTSWLGQPVHAYHLPGHSSDQLGLAPESMAWFLAGDMILDRGTVIIPSEEGDMIEYLNSLRRVIDLHPQVIFPSHGIGQGSPQSLVETLTHRSFRERQVLAYHNKGLSPEGMLKYIYPDLQPYVRPFALENILSHIQKLEREGKL